MIERIKNQIQNLAKEIIATTDNGTPLLWKEKAKTLYELLSVYHFLSQQQEQDATWESHNSQLRAAVSQLENVSFASEKPTPKAEEEDRSVPPLMDTINDILTEMPDQALPEELFKEVAPPPQFEKKESLEDEKNETLPTKKNLNDRFSRGLKIDLNDRLAFIKHLFDDQREDYQRVIQQMMTYSTWEEARGFIEEMVKPEYNHWAGKEPYEARFLQLVELHFELPA